MLLQKNLSRKISPEKSLDFGLKNQSFYLRNAGRRTKFAPVKSLDSSDSDSKIWDLKIFCK